MQTLVYSLSLELSLVIYYYAPFRRKGGILLCTCRSVWSVGPPGGFRMITQERLGLGSWNFIGTLIMTRRWPLLILRSLGQRSRSQVKVTVTGNRHFKDLAWFKQGKQLPFMHVLFVTAVASLVIYLNFTKCKANCRLHYLYLVMPPFAKKKRGILLCTCRSVCRSVGLSTRWFPDDNSRTLGPRIMKLHRNIDHDLQITPIDFEVTGSKVTGQGHGYWK